MCVIFSPFLNSYLFWNVDCTQKQSGHMSYVRIDNTHAINDDASPLSPIVQNICKASAAILQWSCNLE